MLPATRVTNRWPIVWSKTISTGTRESAHDKTAAKGSCFSSRCCFKITRSCSCAVVLPLTKRPFPSINSFRAASGVNVDCASTGRGCRKLWAVSAATPAVTMPATAAAEPRRKLRRDCGVGSVGGNVLDVVTSDIELAPCGRAPHRLDSLVCNRRPIQRFKMMPAPSYQRAGGVGTRSIRAMPYGVRVPVVH